ncbi:MAG: hypothetical protein WA793_11945 [Sphingorhabdus sp.]|uniref:hypothetical protein n=1 Tax=Sphingorhabdus sp. TaxID=1902408 RepID=UPI003CAC7413
MSVARLFLVSLLLASYSPLLAQSATLTVKDGRALVIGGETELAQGLDTTDLSPAKVVDEFTRLCMPEPQNAGSRVDASPFKFVRDDTIFPALGKTGEARIERWAGKGAALFMWAGDETGLKGRPIAMPSRGATTTGPYGPFKAFGAQCNLVINLPDFAAAAVVTELLTVKLGAPRKLVVKNTFADGHWIAGDLRVNVNVPSETQYPQPIHLSVQSIPVGAQKK